MTKKYRFEVRQVEGWADEENGWVWNTSFHVGEFGTDAETNHGIKTAFRRYLRKKYGIIFRPYMTIAEDYGDIIEIQDRKTKEPLFAALLLM